MFARQNKAVRKNRKRSSRGSFGYLPRRRRTSSGTFLPSLCSTVHSEMVERRLNSLDGGGSVHGPSSPRHSLPYMGARPSLYDTIIMLKVCVLEGFMLCLALSTLLMKYMHVVATLKISFVLFCGLHRNHHLHVVIIFIIFTIIFFVVISVAAVVLVIVVVVVIVEVVLVVVMVVVLVVVTKIVVTSLAKKVYAFGSIDLLVCL